MARICQECGNENPGVTLFCRQCGKSLGDAEFVPDKPAKRRGGSAGAAWFWLLVLAGLLGAGYYYVWLPRMDEPVGSEEQVATFEEQVATFEEQVATFKYTAAFDGLMQKAFSPLGHEDGNIDALTAELNTLRARVNAETTKPELQRSGLDFCQGLGELLLDRAKYAAGLDDISSKYHSSLSRQQSALERRQFAISAQQQFWSDCVDQARPVLQRHLDKVRRAE